MDQRFLRPTALLDFEDPGIQALVMKRGWPSLPVSRRIGEIYAYVRDEIAFGYNESDDLPASRVLSDGYGQCNTKTTLLMALLRASGIACRFHGATVHKRLQKGVVNGLFYWLAPDSVVHSWAEVAFAGRWLALEGVILDQEYLRGVREAHCAEGGPFLGFAVGTESIDKPGVDWRETDTFVQKTGVNQDFGVFDDADAFYATHGVNLTGLRGWLFRHRVRRVMNANVARLRSSCPTRIGAQPREAIVHPEPSAPRT
jgi:transglutaminase superfamily protein